jgi:c(7)-type cytochrome triheme protein
MKQGSNGPENPAQNAGSPGTSRVLPLLVVLFGVLGLIFIVTSSRRVTAETAPAPAFFAVTPETFMPLTDTLGQDPKQPRLPNIPTVPLPQQGQAKPYGRFSHVSPGDHAGFGRPGNCSSCHNRAGLSGGTLPGHNACSKCHNFVELGQTPNFCGACHTTAPAVKSVRAIRSFNSLFDHLSHRSSACTACHKPQGARQSIPVSNVGVHGMCYSCHTTGTRLGDCGTCHRPGRPGGWRVGPIGNAYGKAFTHATHSPRQGVNCTECHTVRAGPNGRQVSSTNPQQHFPAGGNTCATCHNDKKSFGEKDFGDCKKCHKGATFRL